MVRRSSALKVLLDISRTIARARLPRATGIDRVERAYIDWALTRPDSGFLARIDGLIYVLGSETLHSLLNWMENDAPSPRLDLRAVLSFQRDLRLRRAQALIRRTALRRTHPRGLADTLRGDGWEGALYLNVGHDNLEPVAVQQIGRAGLKRVVLVHDTIPLDYPEFTRPGTEERFRAKFDVAQMGEAIIANSNDTAARIAQHAGGGTPPISALHLGITPGDPQTSPTEPAHPSFVALGTIEPRKNIRLLLDLWRGLTEELGEQTPHLHLIGRRGWRLSGVAEILDNDTMMGRSVFEHGPLDDAEAQAMLAQSRALLFPSHAEGYGLPLIEALQQGVPAIASDLAAPREICGEVPEWLNSTDMKHWRRMVLEYASPTSTARAAQIQRIESWQPPTWQTHFMGLENLLETILVQPMNRG